MALPPKVFISYRSVDRERVRIVAEALRRAGIDAWWDNWEILPGDNFVAKINQGLDECNCGVVFLSNESLEGAWHFEEITILKNLAVTEKRPLIPVVLDANVKIPPILRVLSRLSADQIPQLIEAIEGRTSKPALGAGTTAPARVRFCILLRELPGQAIGVSAEVDGNPLISELRVSPGADFRFSYSDFLGQMPGARMGSAEEFAQVRRRELQKLGDAVGRVIFPETIGRELGLRLTEAKRLNQEVELIYESASSRLLCIPFEAARLLDGRIPALLPGVFTWRRSPWNQGLPLAQQSPPAGPLRVLVAVGAPDEGKTPNSILDNERELQTILDALEEARQLGNSYVRVLEIGSPDQIGAALREQSYHVLHLSGHGNKGVLELEDEDGNPIQVDAAKLSEKIRDSGHSAPLVFLASCHGGLADHETAGFAQSLLECGVPSVLAMQTAVSDSYASQLAGKFYGELSRAEQPLASRALALARRQIEEDRRTESLKAAPEQSTVPEYATASLFLRGEEQALLDRGLPQAIIQEPVGRAVSSAVPLLSVGNLIGRRREARQLMRVLTDHPQTVAVNGLKAGCQILGTGGVGKSSLAGRVMQRMADRGWPIATVSGAWDLGKIAAALGSALSNHPRKQVAELASELKDLQASDNLRLECIQSILARHRVLLVLDNFEDVLQPAGVGFRDSVTEQIFALILSSAQCGKLLVTSRYPVPGAGDDLHRIDLGPLSRAEVRKLMLRHEGLRRQSSEGVKLIPESGVNTNSQN
jgi:hypothetical protein